MTDDNRNPASVPPKVPSFSTRATPKVAGMVEEPASTVFTGGSEPASLDLAAEGASPILTAEVATGELTEGTGEAATPAPEVDDSHDGSKHGNAWQIIKFTGVMYTLLWAVFSAAAAGAAAFFFAPQPAWIAVAALGFFTGVIAAVDSKTHLIKNEHTVITAAVTIPLGIFVASQLGWWNLLGGGITAIAIFATFFLLILLTGFGSGGDIKFSPVPAFVLGVINPLVGALWLFLSLILTMILLVVFKRKETAFGSGMAISIPLAIIATKFLFDAAGLSYM